MTDGARRYVVLGGALVLLGALVVVLLLRGGDTDGAKGSGRGAARSGDGGFAISGNGIEPIIPGVRAAIDLAFTNPHVIPLAVSDVHVRVREVHAPHADAAHPCTVGDFTVEQVPPGAGVTIPARDRRTLSDLGLPRGTWPHVGLVDRPVNQDGCKGASLVLSYTASGTLGW